MNKLEILIPLLLLPMMLATPLVHAADDEPIVVEPIINIDLDGVISAINQLNTDTGNNVNAVPTSVFDLFTGWVNASMLGFNDTLVEMAEFLLTTNPDPETLYDWWQSVVLIISSLYLLIFLIVGFMFLFSSISTEQRVKAKEWLKGAIIMIIGVSVSFYLYQLILELATGITQFMWITGFEQFFQPSNYVGLDIAGLVFYMFAIGLTTITLFARYIFLLLAVTVFPIGIFLYFIPPLQNWGKMIFNLIGVFLFMQFVDVLAFIAANQVVLGLAGQSFAAYVPALAFMIVGVLNIAIIIYAILKSAFSTADNAPILAFAFGAITSNLGAMASSAQKEMQNNKAEAKA